MRRGEEEQQFGISWCLSINFCMRSQSWFASAMVVNYDDRCRRWEQESWVTGKRSYSCCCWWCSESLVTRQKGGLNQRSSFRYLHTVGEIQFENRGSSQKYCLWSSDENSTRVNDHVIKISPHMHRHHRGASSWCLRCFYQRRNRCFRILGQNHWSYCITQFWI